MVQNGLVQFGMVWYGVVRYGIVWYGTVWYGTIRCGTVRYGTIRYGVVHYGMVGYGMVWYGTVWYSTVWFGGTVRSAHPQLMEKKSPLFWRLRVDCAIEAQPKVTSTKVPGGEEVLFLKFLFSFSFVFDLYICRVFVINVHLTLCTFNEIFAQPNY